MSIADDFRTIAEQANRDLNSAHDFYEHSKFVWESFQGLVGEGRTFSSTNLATGTIVNQDELLKLSTKYTTEYLATLTFRQFVSSFEVFLFRFLHRILLHNPWQFARSQLDFETLLRAADRDEAVSSVILKQLNDLKYESLREWFVALNKAVKLDCPTEDELDSLTEMKASRDILEHNAGVVNEIYRRKAGKKSRYAAGDYVDIDDAYHLECWRLIKKVVNDVSQQSITRLADDAAAPD